MHTALGDMRTAHKIVAVLGAILLVVWLLAPPWSGRSIPSYVAFHTALEIASIVVSVMIFMTWWIARGLQPDRRSTVVATAFLCVAWIDVLHTLSFQGMPEFITPSFPGKAIYFWLAARLMAALGLLAAVYCQTRRDLSRGEDHALLVAAIVIPLLIGWLVLFHPGLLPAMIVPGQGLTHFKIYAEYALVALYAGVAYGAVRRFRARADDERRHLLPFIYAAAAISALSEIFLTLYAAVTDVYNLFGHLYKVIAYALLYRGMVASRFIQPYRELRHNEEALREREAQLAGVVGSLKLAVISVDESQNIVLFNRQAEAIFGCTAAEVIGSSLDRFIPARSRAAHRGMVAAYDGVGEHGSRHMGAERILTGLRANGEEFPIDASISRSEVDGQKRFTVVLRDVTERLRMQRELQRYADIVAHADDAIISRRLDGTILTWNPAAERLFGYRSEDMIGSDIRMLNSPNTPPDQCLLAERALKGEAIVNFETVRRRKDGSDVDVAVTISLVRDSSGKVTTSTAILRDISERKVLEARLHKTLQQQREAEAEVRESRDRLRELSSALQTIREEEKSRIARELHDELGQALTALKMDTSAIESELDHAQAALKKRAADMKQLIDATVTSVRRISADLRPVMLDNLGLVPTLEWLTKDFASRSGITVDLDIPDENLGASGDAATAVFRIVQEALTNVARHAQADHVNVNIVRSGGNVVVRVRDNGKGFTEADTRKARSFGLLGMRERAYVLGGECRVTRHPQGGTQVEALIPAFGTSKGDEQ